MEHMESERIVLDIPVSFTAEELAKLCRVRTDSIAFVTVEESLEYVNEWGAPKSVIKWATVNGVEGDLTTVDGVTFQSRVVADKLKDMPRVFLSVITAGSGLERCEDLEGDPFLDTLNGALLAHATGWTIRYMKEQFGFDGSSMLNPGSLPDWPIRNNFALFDLIGNVEEIGVTLRENGYMKPWNTTSHIHFSGHGYQNCSLCRKYDCVGRRAKFNREEYIRIFGTEP
jgi:hypothetical protein